jgi:Kef-type K+ transport system membrane component KefB
MVVLLAFAVLFLGMLVPPALIAGVALTAIAFVILYPCLSE